MKQYTNLYSNRQCMIHLFRMKWFKNQTINSTKEAITCCIFCSFEDWGVDELIVEDTGKKQVGDA